MAGGAAPIAALLGLVDTPVRILPSGLILVGMDQT